MRVQDELRALRQQMSLMLDHLSKVSEELEHERAVTDKTIDVLVNVFLDLLIEEKGVLITDEERLRIKKRFEDLQQKWLR